MFSHSLTNIALVTVFGAATAACSSAQDDTHIEVPQSGVRLVAMQNQPRQLRLRAPGSLQDFSQLRNDGPRLGVMVETTKDGLKVSEVSDGTLAQSAGVATGDIIYRIGEERVSSVGGVARALTRYAPGDSVPVTVIRAGEGILELSGTLPEPPAQPAPPDVPMADGHRGGFLGVEVGETDDDAAGVLVNGTIPNSAAWFAGLDQGDRLLTLDGTAVDSFEALTGAVASKKPGTVIELVYERDGTQHTTSVRLGQRMPNGPLSMMLAPGQNAQFGMQLPRMRMQGPHGSELFFDDNGDHDWFGGMMGPDGNLPFDHDGNGGPFMFFGGPGALNGLHELLGPADGKSRSVDVNIHDGEGTATVTTDDGTRTFTLQDGRWTETGDGLKTSEDTDGPELREG